MLPFTSSPKSVRVVMVKSFWLERERRVKCVRSSDFARKSSFAWMR